MPKIRSRLIRSIKGSSNEALEQSTARPMRSRGTRRTTQLIGNYGSRSSNTGGGHLVDTRIGFQSNHRPIVNSYSLTGGSSNVYLRNRKKPENSNREKVDTRNSWHRASWSSINQADMESSTYSSKSVSSSGGKHHQKRKIEHKDSVNVKKQRNAVTRARKMSLEPISRNSTSTKSKIKKVVSVKNKTIEPRTSSIGSSNNINNTGINLLPYDTLNAPYLGLNSNTKMQNKMSALQRNFNRRRTVSNINVSGPSSQFAHPLQTMSFTYHQPARDPIICVRTDSKSSLNNLDSTKVNHQDPLIEDEEGYTNSDFSDDTVSDDDNTLDSDNYSQRRETVKRNPNCVEFKKDKDCLSVKKEKLSVHKKESVKQKSSIDSFSSSFTDSNLSIQTTECESPSSKSTGSESGIESFEKSSTEHEESENDCSESFQKIKERVCRRMSTLLSEASDLSKNQKSGKIENLAESAEVQDNSEKIIDDQQDTEKLGKKVNEDESEDEKENKPDCHEIGTQTEMSDSSDDEEIKRLFEDSDNEEKRHSTISGPKFSPLFIRNPDQEKLEKIDEVSERTETEVNDISEIDYSTYGAVKRLRQNFENMIPRSNNNGMISGHGYRDSFCRTDNSYEIPITREKTHHNDSMLVHQSKSRKVSQLPPLPCGKSINGSSPPAQKRGGLIEAGGGGPVYRRTRRKSSNISDLNSKSDYSLILKTPKKSRPNSSTSYASIKNSSSVSSSMFNQNQNVNVRKTVVDIESIDETSSFCSKKLTNREEDENINKGDKIVAAVRKVKMNKQNEIQQQQIIEPLTKSVGKLQNIEKDDSIYYNQSTAFDQSVENVNIIQNGGIVSRLRRGAPVQGDNWMVNRDFNVWV